MLLNAFIYFFGNFFFFFIIKFVFLSFWILFFDEVSNLRNRILTNQKRELAVSNCQWNCNVCIVLLVGVLQNHRPPTGHRPLTTDHRLTDRSSTDPQTIDYQLIDSLSAEQRTHQLTGLPSIDHRLFNSAEH